MLEKIKILIIDDTLPNRVYLSKLLTSEGFETLQAQNGAEGRKTAEKELPDLIILDMMMPGETGLETCRKLKDNSKTYSIPVIFLTADYSKESTVEGLKCGGVDYITKPFHDEEVIARIRNHIQLKAVQNELMAKYSQDLKSISDAQKSILIDPESIPDALFHVYHKPLREAGGDYYDVVKLTENHYIYICADVSGHDIASIVTSSALKTAIRQYTSVIYTPKQIIGQINQLLNKVIDDDLFVSLILLYVNRDTGRASLINAGHPFPLIQHGDGSIELIRERGHMLGTMENPVIKVHETRLKEGDRIFMFTDGLVDELRAPDGYDQIIKALRESEGKSVREQIEILSESISPAADNNDDILIMGVQI
ncbi:fused response regulator/phosphatase [Spirochaeta isovalerica]|uniref:Sigma-B regulation protein RsbU (Phosphoserine phosphatase) n=1 Tax=Spirochaeta isovalerica TaxID=150 RepID=A0A841RBQ0_9SPIO|nr:fused response regulator/phosphatase [Spirochaeta isovalerica]MBB6480329.1 sigma-B regulation protein RsbU (phosphoserine phosphatase) [Spirochaeta isovalerica]